MRLALILAFFSLYHNYRQNEFGEGFLQMKGTIKALEGVLWGHNPVSMYIRTHMYIPYKIDSDTNQQ